MTSRHAGEEIAFDSSRLPFQTSGARDLFPITHHLLPNTHVAGTPAVGLLDCLSTQFVVDVGLQSWSEAMSQERAALTPTRVEMPPPFGPWLRAQRDRSGLSQAEVAALLEASVQSVMGWEKERRYPRRDVEENYRRRIAEAADEAVRCKMALSAALDAIVDERIRAAVARRFCVDVAERVDGWREAGPFLIAEPVAAGS
jgi:transcriptional regulator with XRE-family HTH domain